MNNSYSMIEKINMMKQLSLSEQLNIFEQRAAKEEEDTIMHKSFIMDRLATDNSEAMKIKLFTAASASIEETKVICELFN